MKKDQYILEDSVSALVVTSLITPEIMKCVTQLAIPRTTRIEHWMDSQCVKQTGETDGHWTVRIMARRTFRPERSLIEIQIRCPKDEKTGFTGINMKAEVLSEGEEVVLKRTAWTGVYNQERFG